MRLVTWNCCRGPFARKSAFLHEFRADIAVLQECARPVGDETNVLWAGENPRQGVAVVAGEGWRVKRIETGTEPPRWVVPFRVSGPVDFTLVAVWILPTRGSYVRTMLHGIEALRDLISSGPAVVIGDYNANPVFDAKRARLNYAAIESLLGDLGLASAYHAFHAERAGEESRATYYHMWRRDLAYHLDYCFVPRDWLPSVTAVEVGSFEEWEGRSDHRPVIVDLDQVPVVC
jgi:endonuclease/exonuclease/phosphatase family metal-dependent hydrolase